MKKLMAMEGLTQTQMDAMDTTEVIADLFYNVTKVLRIFDRLVYRFICNNAPYTGSNCLKCLFSEFILRQDCFFLVRFHRIYFWNFIRKCLFLEFASETL